MEDNNAQFSKYIKPFGFKQIHTYIITQKGNLVNIKGAWNEKQIL